MHSLGVGTAGKNQEIPNCKMHLTAIHALHLQVCLTDELTTVISILTPPCAQTTVPTLS